MNNLHWSDVLRGFNNSTPGDAARRQVVRYNSPEVHGFVLSASWGEDDVWDAALTYKEKFRRFQRARQSRLWREQRSRHA